VSMATILIIVGLVIMLVGVVVFLLPAPEEKPAPEALVGEVAEVFKQVAALLDKLDKRYRPGLILMLVGLAVVGSGVYLESVDAKHAAKKAGTPTALVGGNNLREGR
jgi:uncharacterized membrane protein